MNDFIDQLETELLAAAHRRAAVPSRPVVPSRRSRLLGDLRATARGALLTASIGAVVIVVAVVLAAGHHRSHQHSAASGGGGAAAELRPSTTYPTSACPGGRRTAVVQSAPSSGVRDLLTGDRHATRRETRIAIRRLDTDAVEVGVIYRRFVRVVRFGSGIKVVLIPATVCNITINRSTWTRFQPTMLAELVGPSLTTTMNLGTLGQIAKGSAFGQIGKSAPTDSIIARAAGRLRSVAMVPASGVVTRVECPLGPSGHSASFTPNHHVVLLSGPAARYPCNLVLHNPGGTSTTPPPVPPIDRS